MPNTTPLINGTTYYASQTLNGCKGPRLAITVQVQLGVEDFDNIKISYSPNPVTSVLDIKCEETIKSVSVLNTLGQIVYSKNYDENNLQLDLSGLPAGSYFVKVKNEEKMKFFKIIKK